MQEIIYDNNPYLLIAGTDQPQRDGDGNPIVNPNFGHSTTVTHADANPQPLILSKTDFNKHGWAAIGMAAFQKILETVRASTTTTDAAYEARAAVNQYDSAQFFEKSEVEALGQLLVAGGFMTSDQYAAITGVNWPTT